VTPEPIHDQEEPTADTAERWERGREEDEALFFAGLKLTSGRSTEEWMAWLDAMADTATRNGMLALLQERGGFAFRWASVLERMWVQGRQGGGPSTPDGLPPSVRGEPAAAPAPREQARAPPTAVDSMACAVPAAGVGSIDAGAVSRPPDVPYAQSPREHAEALAQHVAQHRGELPAEIFWKQLVEVHGGMCRAIGWTVRPWNPVAAELARLIGEPHPLYLWVRGPKGTQRLRFYSVSRIAAAGSAAAGRGERLAA
jgi:hypothetical protein